MHADQCKPLSRNTSQSTERFKVQKTFKVEFALHLHLLPHMLLPEYFAITPNSICVDPCARDNEVWMPGNGEATTNTHTSPVGEEKEHNTEITAICQFGQEPENED
jgi:hypothetical protein